MYAFDLLIIASLKLVAAVKVLTRRASLGFIHELCYHEGVGLLVHGMSVGMKVGRNDGEIAGFLAPPPKTDHIMVQFGPLADTTLQRLWP
jgi:hypothetical protein